MRYCTEIMTSDAEKKKKSPNKLMKNKGIYLCNSFILAQMYSNLKAGLRKCSCILYYVFGIYHKMLIFHFWFRFCLCLITKCVCCGFSGMPHLDENKTNNHNCNNKLFWLTFSTSSITWGHDHMIACMVTVTERCRNVLWRRITLYCL